MNLKIDRIIEGADRISEKVAEELPGHSGLAGAIEEVKKAARQAKKVTFAGRRIFSLNRLPAAFLALSLIGFLLWVYWNFFMVSGISVAVPSHNFRDENLKYFRTPLMRTRKVDKSSEAIQLVRTGRVDVAFIQAGVPGTENLTILQTPVDEYVIWMTRDPRPVETPIASVMTNLEDEGSHSVAKDFLRTWKLPSSITFHHEWDKIAPGRDSTRSSYTIPADLDAVFVVINVTDPNYVETIKRLVQEGFELQSPYIGAQASQLRYAKEFRMPKGYISQDPMIPSKDVLTYTVPNILVAKRGISDSKLASLAKLFDTETHVVQAKEYSIDTTEASEVFQGLDAILGILINIILGFIALLGLEIWSYRKKFHELNSLVSLLSMLQSNKDILGETDRDRRSENLLYLSTVSDLLSLISSINGYYTQENSSLLFNNQTEVIHQRCDNLKLNIQLKILHAGIQIEPRKKPLDATPTTELLAEQTPEIKSLDARSPSP
ncbi:MAG: hypothetical protein ACKOAU_06620 [Pirellula sp.]